MKSLYSFLCFAFTLLTQTLAAQGTCSFSTTSATPLTSISQSGANCTYQITFVTNVSNTGAANGDFSITSSNVTLTQIGNHSVSAPFVITSVYQFTTSCSGGPINFTATFDGNGPKDCTNTPLTLSVGLALPIELVSFQSSVERGQNRLAWVTASERDNDYFSVERSGDGQIFAPIGRVSGKGNSQTLQTYAFEDKNPPRRAYYRLAQTDYDGSVHYSNIISAIRTEGSLDISAVSPNPVKEQAIFSLETPEERALTMTLFNAAGIAVRQWSVEALKGAQTHTLDLSDLPGGMYFVAVSDAKERVIQKFIKE